MQTVAGQLPPPQLAWHLIRVRVRGRGRGRVRVRVRVRVGVRHLRPRLLCELLRGRYSKYSTEG